MSGKSPAIIRPARAQDKEQILRLLQLGLKEQEQFAAACDPPEDEGFFVEEFAEHRAGLDDQDGVWSVAVDNGTVLGVLWLRFETDSLGPYGTVRQIIVDPIHRRRGVGTQLLEEAEVRVRRSDAVMFLISAFRSNSALRLYRSLGFSDFPEEFRLDNNPEHVVLWKKL